MLAAHFAADHCHRLHSTFQAVQAGGKRSNQQRCSTLREQRLLKRELVSCQAVKPGKAAVDGTPADGADGADVYLVCDPALDSLLHLHRKSNWAGARGGQGNPAVGSAGPKRNAQLKKASTPPLEVPVPPGTVVKRKSTGQKQRDLQRELKAAAKAGGEVVAVEDVNWRDDSKGLPGRQLGLHLLLRVVADVGIVGFPNAGAHVGKGLGRMFLRHLRRTQVLLHVVDASAADPATDYLAVREELRLYNPDYVTRPHVVALNKMDLEDAGEGVQQLAAALQATLQQLKSSGGEAAHDKGHLQVQLQQGGDLQQLRQGEGVGVFETTSISAAVSAALASIGESSQRQHTMQASTAPGSAGPSELQGHSDDDDDDDGEDELEVDDFQYEEDEDEYYEDEVVEDEYELGMVA
eukprot:gene6449-6678_t